MLCYATGGLFKLPVTIDNPKGAARMYVACMLIHATITQYKNRK